MGISLTRISCGHLPVGDVIDEHAAGIVADRGL